MLILVESPASHPKFPENGLPYRGSPFSQGGPHFTGNMGTPGSHAYSQENEDPGPYIPGSMGTPILRDPHFHMTPVWSSTVHSKMISAECILDINWKKKLHSEIGKHILKVSKYRADLIGL